MQKSKVYLLDLTAKNLPEENEVRYKIKKEHIR